MWEIFLGALLGLGTAIWLEWLKRPKIAISLRPDDHDHQIGNFTYRFIHVHVENRAPNLLLRWFVLRQSATPCEARLLYFDEVGRQLLASYVRGRWSYGLEPRVRYPGNVIWEAQLREMAFRDLHPGHIEELDIAVKSYQHPDIYAHCDASYFGENWPLNPNYRINQGPVIVQVDVFGPGVSAKKSFKLIVDPRTGGIEAWDHER